MVEEDEVRLCFLSTTSMSSPYSIAAYISKNLVNESGVKTGLKNEGVL